MMSSKNSLLTLVKLSLDKQLKTQGTMLQKHATEETVNEQVKLMMNCGNNDGRKSSPAVGRKATKVAVPFSNS
jgi:hypothetical protein